MNKKKDEIIKSKTKVVPFMGNEKHIGQNEYLDFDNAAYRMLHRASTEWPCLSCDFLSGELAHFGAYSNFSPELKEAVNYPIEIYGVAGSQASMPSKNKIYVMRMANLFSTMHDDDPEVDGNEEEFNEGNPIILHRGIKIKGGVNRIRSMQGYPIVAMWSETRQVRIYDISEQVQELKNIDYKEKLQRKPKTVEMGPISHFKYKSEGYGLDWSTQVIGRLASGSCGGELQIYEAQDQNCSGFKKLGNPYSFHEGSIEDVQFSPNDSNTVSTCSTDGTVHFYDLRKPQNSGPGLVLNVADCDINVVSWNPSNAIHFAAGADDGSFKVYDIRHPEEEPITNIYWHEDQITSIQWQPGDKYTLAVGSADNRVSIWDFSVESDLGMKDDAEAEIPEQIIFLHQGQEDVKELRWSPYLKNTMMTTALSGFNLFQPGTDQMTEDMEDTGM
jgi:ribosome assembly protein RRB1